MNRFLPALILIVAFAATGWADTRADLTPGGEATGQQPSSGDTDVDSAASPYAGRPELGRRLQTQIQTQIVEAITEALDENPDLSDTDRQAVEQALKKAPSFGNINLDLDENGAGELILGGLAIVLIFGTPIMLVAAFLYAGHRKRRLASNMAGQFLANGQPVPPEVWRGLAGDPTPRSNLHKGMIMLGLGLGIFLCFWLIGSPEAAYLGLIPLFIGIAQLLIWKLEEQKQKPDPEE